MNPDDPLGLIGRPQQDDPLGLKTHRTPKPGMMGKPIVDASPEQADDPNDVSAFVAKHVLNAAQGIPGMEALESAAGVIGSHIAGKPLSFEQSRDALRSQASTISPVVSGIERMAGTAPLLPFLPSNPVIAGGLLNGLNSALSPDTESAGDRLAHTALGAATGAAFGRALETAAISGRSLLGETPSSGLLEQYAKLTPKAVAEWAKTATTAQKKEAADVILGAVKDAPKVRTKFHIPINASKEVLKAKGLLEQLDPNDVLKNLPRYGLLALSASR